MKRIVFLLLLLIAQVFTALAQQTFSGIGFDQHSGLYNCRNRAFDPETGTFLQKDPIGVSGGVNTYLYCLNNPVNLIDPLGVDWIDNILNTGTGIADAMTFNVIKYARSWVTLGGYNDAINYSSGGYIGGQVVGTIGTFAYGTGEINAGVKGLQPASDAEAVIADAVASGREVKVIGQNMANNVLPTAENLELDATATFNYSPRVQQLFAETGDTLAAQIENQQWLFDAAGNDALFVNSSYSGAGSVEIYEMEKTLLSDCGVETFSYSANMGRAAGETLMSGLFPGVANTTIQLSSDSTPPVGGVLLDKAATLVGANLSDITGAMYDPVSGQFVILGTNNPAPVKGINLDYLYTALQAVYGSAVPPFVTLVPSAIITAFYTYDERNLMTGYADATNQILYTYNGDAQRMSSILNGAQTSYVIDPNRSVYEVVQERNGSGTITASYTFGTTRLATWNGSVVTFELNDRLGSVRLVTDTSGNVIQGYNYDAFGASR